MLGESRLTLGKNDDIDKAAREWASVIKNVEARKDAEAAARILLSHGIKLPRLMKKKLGATVGAEYSAPIGEGFDGILYFNERRERDYKSYREKKMKYGSGAQDNTFLHELGHHIDCMLEPKAYSTVEHQWDMKGVNKELIQKELSRYALQNRAEFEAELISATLRGRTFSKELLSYSNLNSPEKMDELAGKLLGYASGKDLCTPSEDLRQKFEGMMRALYQEEGASLRIGILAEPAAQEFIGLHAETLDGSFKQVEMSDIMRQRLSRSNYVFSGMKAFHELNEAFPSLLDENGNRKTFERFLKDVRSIDATYNSNYLRSEFNFVQASAEMAAKWEGFMQDGDRYYLQYRTAHDNKVRPEHAALHGVTLPITDSFWEEYYPPNGWNCRCTVVQVRKSRYPATPHDEAMALGEEALQRDTNGMFRFNPGKQEKAVPDYNPYTISRCRDCDIAKGKAKLAKAFIPDNELCQACQTLRQALERRRNRRPTLQEFRELSEKVNGWADGNLDTVQLPDSAETGNPAKRSYVTSSDGYRIGVGKKFFNEMMAKNKRNPELPDIVEASMNFREWIPQANRVRTEEGRHHDFGFSVYHVEWNGHTIEFKCKITDGELLYNMTFI